MGLYIIEEDYGYETEEDAEEFGFRRLGELKSNSSSELTLETNQRWRDLEEEK